MKPLFTLFLLSVLLFSNKVNAQIRNVIVEKYYISDALDATDSSNYYNGDTAYSTRFLAVGSTTYRVYVELDSGFKIKKIYGTPCNPLKIASTSNFFNIIDWPTYTFGYKINKAKFRNDPMLALDSWLTLGLATTLHRGVLKTEDTDGSIVGDSIYNNGGTFGISSGLIINNDPAAGIPVDSVDGLMPNTVPMGLWSDYSLLDGNGVDTTVFGSVQVGSSFYSTSAFLKQNDGVRGLVPSSNKVMVAQLTTTGDLSFEINLELVDSTGGIHTGDLLNFVAGSSCGTPGGDTLVSPKLKFPPDAPVCGCGDPNFLEYNANAPCFNDSLCNNRIVFGCMDTLACNYDPHANYHIQYLCCYPGKCNDRDINLVCPGIISNSGFTLYPNPVSNVLNIEITIDGAQETKYLIYDAYGTEIRNHDFGTQSGTISQQIDVSDFQMGLYLIRVFHGATSESKTFMKN